MKKNIILIFVFLFGFLLIPKDVFASDYSFQYIDNYASLNQDDISSIYSRMYNQLSLNDQTTILNNDSYLILDTYHINFSSIYNSSFKDVFSDFSSRGLDCRYILLTIPSVDVSKSYFSLNLNGYITFYFSYNRAVANFWFFDSDMNIMSSDKFNALNGVRSWLSFDLIEKDFTIYNPVIYSYNIDLFSREILHDYDIYQGDQLLTTIYSNNENFNYFDLRSTYETEVTFKINPIHEISLSILGDDIPDQFSFIYLIFDYLLLFGFVVVILSPFVIIVRLLRWS